MRTTVDGCVASRDQLAQFSQYPQCCFVCADIELNKLTEWGGDYSDNNENEAVEEYPGIHILPWLLVKQVFYMNITGTAGRKWSIIIVA